MTLTYSRLLPTLLCTTFLTATAASCALVPKAMRPASTASQPAAQAQSATPTPTWTSLIRGNYDPTGIENRFATAEEQLVSLNAGDSSAMPSEIPIYKAMKALGGMPKAHRERAEAVWSKFESHAAADLEELADARFQSIVQSTGFLETKVRAFIRLDVYGPLQAIRAKRWQVDDLDKRIEGLRGFVGKYQQANKQAKGGNTRSSVLLDYAEKQSALARPQMVHYYKLLEKLSEVEASDLLLSRLNKDLGKVSSTIRAEEQRTRYKVSSCRGSHAPKARQLCKLSMRRSKLLSKKAAREKALRASIVRI